MTTTSRPKHVIPRIVAVLAVALALALANPGIAAAGGPTSVLLASPASQSAAGLYTADADYQALNRLLGGDSVPATSAADRPRNADGPYVTATWLIHDVMVWRIDRIFFLGADDVWVVTETSWDGGLTGEGLSPNESGSATAVWHRPADPEALTALLGKYGLVAGSDSLDGGIPIGASDSAAQAASGGPADEDAAIQNTAGVDDASWTSSGWLWAAIGLVVGIAGTAAVLYLAPIGRRSGRPRADEPPVPMIPVQ